MSANQITLLYLLASVCFILALKGLSSPATARRGNLLGMTGMAIRIRSMRPRTTTARVVSTAMVMPAMPNRLPRRAVVGEDSPLSARMKHTEATRYQRVI